MRSRGLGLAGLFLLGALGVAPAAAGQTGVAEVERAYSDVDFEKSRRLARATLENGNNDRSSTKRLYLLWAISAAALDHNDEARSAFTCALAADPGLRLEKSLSPKVRGPYLEARGGLPTEQGRAPLEVTLQRRQQVLELGLYDALHVAERLVLLTRATSDETFTQRRFEPSPLRRIPLPSGTNLEFVLQAQDQYGNVLFEQGTRDEPRRLALGGVSELQRRPDAAGRANPTPYYATAVALATLGVASGVGGGVMYSRREDAAREWNGPSCERQGQSRGQQCGSVDERRQRAELIAIGLSAAGGALLLSSLATLLLAPASTPTRSALELEASPRGLGLSYRGAL